MTSINPFPWSPTQYNGDKDKYYTSNLYKFIEWSKFIQGSLLLLLACPYVALQIIMCNFWDQIDKRFFRIIPYIQKLSRQSQSHMRSFVKHKDDGFIFHLLIWLGIILPTWFFYELYIAFNFGFSWKRVLFYNIVRIGPMYVNFMYTYVLCHKEAHSFGNLFANKLNLPFPFGLKYVFNHWVGLFHGVIPGTFTYSHIYNHHHYDNDENDIYSTAFRPRDKFSSWLSYLPEWFAYASNISTIHFFIKQKKLKFLIYTLFSSLYYFAFLGFSWYIHPKFTLFTLIYAFIEGNILLSIVNYVWHAFIDPDDPSNDFINSTTVIDGLNFTLGEEYHVVHHQYAGSHWTNNSKLYLKHIEEYKNCIPSTFYKQNIGFIFGYIITQNYSKLVDIYYKPFLPKNISNIK